MSFKYLLLFTVAISYLSFLTKPYLTNRENKIFFLDVGQGDSILITTELNKSILIDGGPDQDLPYKIAKHLAFYDRTIDLIILTHSDADHLAGLLPVLEKYQVKEVLITGIWSDSSLYESFLKLLKENNVEISFANTKKSYSFDSVNINILYPLTEQKFLSYDNINDSSVVTLVSGKNKKILLMGDLELAGIDILTRYINNLSADILKIGHHGSKNATTKELLEKVSPEIAILSYGLDNKFGHPHEEILKLLEEKSITLCETINEDCYFIF